jgi:hypothetical protein
MYWLCFSNTNDNAEYCVWNRRASEKLAVLQCFPYFAGMVAVFPEYLFSLLPILTKQL